MNAEEAMKVSLENVNMTTIEEIYVEIGAAARRGDTRLYRDFKGIEKVYLVNQGYWFGSHKDMEFVDGKPIEFIKHYITWFKLNV